MSFIKDTFKKAKNTVSNTVNTVKAAAPGGGGSGGGTNNVNTNVQSNPEISVNPVITIGMDKVAQATLTGALENAKALRITGSEQSAAVKEAAQVQAETQLNTALIQSESVNNLGRNALFLFTALGLIFIFKKRSK